MGVLADPYALLSAEELQQQLALTKRALTLSVEREAGRSWRHFAAYADRPVEFIQDILGQYVYSAQRVIAEAVRDNKYVAIRSCHDSGKSFIAACLVCWFLATRRPGTAFVVTTAPTFTQVRAILWREINRAHAAGRLPGRVNQTTWLMPTMAGEELVGMGRKPADYDIDAFQGIHAMVSAEDALGGGVFVVLDEAAGVPKALWDATEGLVTTDESRVLAIGHPDNEASDFGKACKPNSGWARLKISYHNTPNFTGEEVPPHVAKALLSRNWVEDKLKKWGKEHPLFQSRVLGDFPTTRTDLLIPLTWANRAQERETENRDQGIPIADEPRELGVDVGHTGTAESIIYLRAGRRALLYEVIQGKKTMQVAGAVIRAWRATQATLVKIDNVGIGAGVCDRIEELNKDEELGLPLARMPGGAASNDPEQYQNARAEWHWELRKLFENDQIDLDPDEETAAQITNIKWDTDSKGRIRIESKEQMEARGLPSPDRGDGLAMAFGKPPPPSKKKRPGKLKRASRV